jgi:hypothetical protein
MLKRRRKVGRPLLVATAGIAAMAYACGSQVSGNLAPSDSGPPPDTGIDMNASDVGGNLVAVEAGPDQNAGDASDASTDAPDGG